MPVQGAEDGSALCAELQQLVAKELGKPLCPEKIFIVSELPRTRNAKIMRRVIRSAYLNLDLGNISALENPEAVEAIQQIALGQHKERGS